jgi:putative aldouronate transport system permease protein
LQEITEIKRENRVLRPKKKSLISEIWKYRTLMLMLLPTLIYFIVFRYGPIFGIVIGFQDFTPQAGRSFIGSILDSKFVGFKHFKDFFTSLTGMQVLKNTIIISFYKIVFGFPAPIILALLLNEMRNAGFKRIFQTISYLPHFISWVILAGILRIVFSPDYGLIVPVFNALNIPVINFLGDSRYFRGLLVGTDIWQSIGWGSIIYLAAITNVDADLYEAARIDGAGRFKQLIHITLPAISATIVVMLILRTGSILNAGFDQAFNLYNPAVYEVGDIIDTHVFRAGIERMRFSYTTAVGIFQSFVGFIMVMATNFIAKKLGQEGIV